MGSPLTEATNLRKHAKFDRVWPGYERMIGNSVVRREGVIRYAVIGRGLRRFLPISLRRADLALFRRVARANLPVLGPTMRPLSDAANRSRLWMLIALVLAVFGGRFGRRAALRGLLSVGATSAFVNLPAKWLAGRRRPEIDLVPQGRRLLQLPASSSFPSGHAASAFAFAVGASQELPWLIAPLAALATGVAFSRVYTGVHYPSDVVAGAAAGTTFALASRHWWPIAPRCPAAMRPTLFPRVAQPLPDGTGLVVVVNAESGAMLSSPGESLREKLPGAEVIEVEPERLQEALEEAADRAVVLGVAGGDGTVSAAAGVAHRGGKPLLVVPAGTLNHLARDLAVESLEQAVDALREGTIAELDLGRVAGRPFVNTASFGHYSRLVDARERLEGVIGKWQALLVGFVHVLRRASPIDVEVDGRRRRIWMSFVGNCRYYPSGFAPSRRKRLNDGRLDVRLIHARHTLAGLLPALLTGRVGRSRVYEEWEATSVKVRSHQGPLRLAADGETFDGPTEFEITKEERPLLVYVARPGASAA